MKNKVLPKTIEIEVPLLVNTRVTARNYRRKGFVESGTIASTTTGWDYEGNYKHWYQIKLDRTGKHLFDNHYRPLFITISGKDIVEILD